MKTMGTRNEAPDDMDYTDPSLKYKNLEFEENSKFAFKGFHSGPDEELCWACGWNTRNQQYSSYGSRVRVMHTRGNSGIWTLGTRYILRDDRNDRFLGNNYITLKFLHKQPGLTIPLPKEIQSLSQPGDPIYLTLESRVPGDTLMEVWRTLSQVEKASYSRQMADVIRQLRRFTAPRPQKVDGGQLDDVVLGKCFMRRPGNCWKIPYKVDEWLDGLGADLRIGLSRVHKTTDPVVIEEKFQELKASFPDCEPYVLTHADLNLSNIIVKDGKIQGIVDWEQAGYYPWWFERRATYGLYDGPTEELFDPVWDELMPEVDYGKWSELIDKKMFPAVQAWGHAMHNHPGETTNWWMPSFCECKHIRGGFRASDWGMPVSCKIGDTTAEEEALLEGYKRKDPWL